MSVEAAETSSKEVQTPLWKEQMEDYSQNATMHGVGHAFDSKAGRFRRCLWLLFLTVSFTICTTMVITQILYYFTYPISTVETTVEASVLDFPTVTICNYNLVKRSVVEADPVLAKVVQSLDVNGPPLNWSDPQLSSYLDLDLTDVSISAAHTLDETLLLCEWNREPINCSSYFETITSDMNVCYAFHTRNFIEEHGVLTVDRRGTSKGLRIQANVKQEEYLDNGMSQSAAGLRVVVHDPNNMPIVDELAVPISPGTETHLSIMQRKMKRLPDPYEGGGCLDTKSSDFVNPLEYFCYYTYDGCRQERAYRFVEHACGCIPFMVQVKDLPRPYCTLQQSMDCSIINMYEYHMNATLSESSSTSYQCEVPCEETHYTTSQSFALFPSDFVLEELQMSHNLTGEYIRSNMLELVVYYQVMNYASVEQVAAYSSTNAIGDIGGQMGICLGASILTLIELGDFLIRVCAGLCCRRKK